MSSSGVNLLQEKALDLILLGFFYVVIAMAAEITFCRNVNWSCMK